MNLSRSILLSALVLLLANCSVKATTGRAAGGLPGPSPKPQDVVGIALASGDFRPSAGNLRACAQNIGTATANDVIIGLYVTLMPPCNGSTTLFNCETTNVCSANGAVITIKSVNSYEYTDTVANWTATFTQ
jgi:hypothetical protein